MKLKLIELMDKAEEWADKKCDELDCDECPAYKKLCNCMDYLVADYLIANGVTIQKWIPVSERLPEINERVLVWYRDKIGKKGIDTDRCWGRLGKWVRFGDGVTHWMPLPLKKPEGE